MKLTTLGLAIASIIATASVAAQATALSYNNADTTGTADTSTGYFHLATSNGTKASFYLFKSDATPLGTLADLNSINFDYKVNTNTTPVLSSAPAIRFFLSNGTSLVWENAYQAVQTTDTTWHNDVNVGAGQFWQRANSHNFDQISNLNTKSGFEGGFIPTDVPFVGLPENGALSITSFQISFGSGIAGDFDAYVDDVKIGFGGANPQSFTAAVPEPTTLAALAGASALGLGRRRRA